MSNIFDPHEQAPKGHRVGSGSARIISAGTLAGGSHEKVKIGSPGRVKG